MEDLKFIANWVEDFNNLYLSSNDDSRGTVQLKSGAGEAGTDTTVKAAAEEGYVFKGWFNKDTEKMVSPLEQYSFTMPASGNLNLEAQFVSLEELGAKPVKHGKTISYGLYPMNKVTDTTVIGILSNNGGLHQPNDYFYWNLGFYCLENGEYFKCEPVEWVCMDATNRVYISKYIVDASSYYALEVLHPTRYAYSTLQTMLESVVYQQVFGFGDAYLKLSTVDNSPETTNSDNNPYCPKPGDLDYNLSNQHLYAPSYRELRDNDLGFSSNPNATKTRKAFVTEYAVARGLTTNSYWTRSPVSNTEEESEVWAVDYTGALVEVSVEQKLGNRPVVQFTSAIDSL